MTKEVLRFEKSLKAIQKIFGDKTPDCALVIGSGLNDVVNEFNALHSIPYSDIPHFPIGNIQGHTGHLHIGTIQDKTILIFSGRFHHYQGLQTSIAAAPAWVAGFWGIPLLITTNASGGISKRFNAGDMVLIRDHIFLQNNHPLFGINLPQWDNPFVDLTQAYDEQLQYSILQCAKQNNLKLHQGIYACVDGPAYETPAEIEMLRGMKADMVGMSTVAEVIVARKMGMKIVGISMIANMSAGFEGTGQPITHDDVLYRMQISQGNLAKLLSSWLDSAKF